MIHRLLLTISLLTIFVIAHGAVRSALYPDPYAETGSQELMDNAMRLYNEGHTDSCMKLLEVINLRSSRPSLSHDEAETISRSVNLLGALYIYRYHDYLKGSTLFHKAMDLALKHKCRIAEAETLNNLTTLQSEETRLRHHNQELPQELEDNYIKVFHLAREYSQERLALHSALNCGLSAMQGKQFDKAASVLEEALQMIGSDSVAVLRCRALLEVNSRDYPRALATLDTARRIISASRTLPPVYSYRVDMMRAQVLELSGDKAAARAIYRRLIGEAQESNECVVLFDLYDTMRGHALEAGDTARAKDWELAMYRTAYESNQTVSMAMTEGRNLYDIEKFREALATSETLATEYRHRLGIIAAFTVLVLMLLAVIWTKLVQVKRSKALLVKKDLEMHALGRTFEDKCGDTCEPLAVQAILPVLNPEGEREPAGPSAREAEVFAKVQKIMAAGGEVFEESFTAVRLAELVGERQSTVSAAIKSCTGSGFGALLAERRIKEAARRFIDRERYGNLTIEAVAMGVGYKSRPHFCTTFKKIMGLSPKEYINQVRLQSASLHMENA